MRFTDVDSEDVLEILETLHLYYSRVKGWFRRGLGRLTRNVWSVSGFTLAVYLFRAGESILLLNVTCDDQTRICNIKIETWSSLRGLVGPSPDLGVEQRMSKALNFAFEAFYSLLESDNPSEPF